MASSSNPDTPNNISYKPGDEEAIIDFIDALFFAPQSKDDQTVENFLSDKLEKIRIKEPEPVESEDKLEVFEEEENPSEEILERARKGLIKAFEESKKASEDLKKLVEKREETFEELRKAFEKTEETFEELKKSVEKREETFEEKEEKALDKRKQALKTTKHEIIWDNLPHFLKRRQDGFVANELFWTTLRKLFKTFKKNGYKLPIMKDFYLSLDHWILAVMVAFERYNETETNNCKHEKQCFCIMVSPSREYQQINVDKKKVLVHRLMCTIQNGPPNESYYVASHLCGHFSEEGQYACVHPEHLWWESQKVNVERITCHKNKECSGKHQPRCIVLKPE